MTDDTTAREALAAALRATFRNWEVGGNDAWLDWADRLLASPALDAVVAERVTALAEDERLRFSEPEIDSAQEAMQEGEWQWFQWLLREKVRALAAALRERGQS